MTTLNEHELHAMAAKLRNAIGPADLQPDYLRAAMADTADTFDDAAEGKASQEAVQASVDLLNAAFDRQLAEAFARFDKSEASEDPGEWRDAMMDLLTAMPEWELAVFRNAFDIALEHMAAVAVKEFMQMEPAGSC